MSLRERLEQRGRSTATFPLRVESTDAVADAARALDEAHEGGDPYEVAAAQARLDGCYEMLRITALEPGDYEALVAAHPPPDAKKDEASWDPVTFVPALFAETISGDDTEADWADYTSKILEPGEVQDLFGTVLGVHFRSPDPRVGKGSTGIRN